MIQHPQVLPVRDFRALCYSLMRRIWKQSHQIIEHMRLPQMEHNQKEMFCGWPFRKKTNNLKMNNLILFFFKTQFSVAKLLKIYHVYHAKKFHISANTSVKPTRNESPKLALLVKRYLAQHIFQLNNSERVTKTCFTGEMILAVKSAQHK